jgi:hydrogenase 3 maturation protease
MKLKHLKEKLKGFDSSKIVFIGLGNELRGDDWAGIYLLRKLRSERVFSHSLFIEAGISPENYITAVLDYDPDLIVFIDSVRCGGPPGQIRFIEPEDIEDSGFSTHSYSIKLIERFFVYNKDMEFSYIGIVSHRTDFVNSLSPQVLKSINHFFGQPV